MTVSDELDRFASADVCIYKSIEISRRRTQAELKARRPVNSESHLHEVARVALHFAHDSLQRALNNAKQSQQRISELQAEHLHEQARTSSCL